MKRILLWLKKNMRSEFFTMFKYGTIGVLNTAVFSIVTYVTSLTSVHYSVYTAVGYTVAILFSFVMNNTFTFNKREQKIKPLLAKFLTVTLSLMLFVQIIQFICIDLLGQHELVGIVIGMFFYTGGGYILNRNFVFKHKNR